MEHDVLLQSPLCDAGLYQRAAAAQQPDDEQHDGDDQQNVDERARSSRCASSHAING
jgi:hypothetical protein